MFACVSKISQPKFRYYDTMEDISSEFSMCVLSDELATTWTIFIAPNHLEHFQGFSASKKSLDADSCNYSRKSSSFLLDLLFCSLKAFVNNPK